MAQPTAHEALIYLMVVMSASDRDMTDSELNQIGVLVRSLPVFDGFDPERLLDVAQQCQKLLQGDDGLGKVIAAVWESVPAALHETAYVLAVDVAAADLDITREETRILDVIRSRLDVDPLAAAAIERAARARYRTL
jgi:tellurite resistance protein